MKTYNTTNNLHRLCFIFFLTVLGSIQAVAQCTNTSAFGSATLSAISGGTAIISCNYAGEYGTWAGAVAGNTYTFRSTISGDFLTIHSGTSNGAVVAFGPQPLVYTATASGTLFVHVNTNSSCGTVSSCRDITATTTIPLCVGTPSPGNTISSANPVCGGVNFTLSLQNQTSGGAVTYQWQKAPDVSGVAGSYSNIAGANLATLTTFQTSATWYQCLVSCNGGTQVLSNAVQLTMKPVNTCYCTPPTSTAACQYMWITNVTASGVLNFNNTTACAATSYTDYSATQIASQIGGQTVNMSFSSITYGMGYSVWIDFNDNGTFDASEKVISTYTGAITNVPGSFTVPLTAPVGTHRMRVRGDYATAPTDPCAQFTYGETEDYGFTVIPLPPCSGTPSPGNTMASGNAGCGNFTLSLQNNPLTSGLAYQWQQNTSSGFTNIIGANASTLSISLAGNTTYHCIVTCTNSGLSGTSSDLFLSLTGVAAGQETNPDNKGRDFWIGVPGNESSVVPQLYITSDFGSCVNVDIPGLAFNTTVSVAGGSLVTVNLPVDAQIQSQYIVENKGIHITSNNSVTVYLMNAQQSTTDAYMALPTDVLGTDYYSMGYYRDFAFSTLFAQTTIVGTQNATTVTITTTTTAGGFTTGVPQNITLNQGQIYQLRSNAGSPLADYTGTRIQSNKPVAVFGGNNCTNISGSLRACDHLVEQLPPTSTWGKSFVTVPLATRSAGDVFRMMAQTSGTAVKINGTLVATLNAGQFYETILSSTSYNRITANEPILVGQYSQSSQADNVTSDPFFTLLPPDEQFLNHYVVSAGTSNIPINFVNIVSPTSNTGTVQVDGATVSGALWNVIPSTTFSGAKVPVSSGVHSVNSTGPVGVMVYGFGSFDSYGYLGGQSFAPIATITNLALTPKTGTDEVCHNHCWNALLTDQFSAPVSGVRVDFTVTGANASNGFSFTNASGIATFCYTGGNTGNDNITAAVGGISDAASFSWLTSTLAPANAGPDQSVTGTNSAHLAANTPDSGLGSWSVTSGSGTFSQVNDPNATVTDMSPGNNVYRWTITNSPCAASFDEVAINYNPCVPPTIICPADRSSFTDPGSCSALVSFDAPVTTGNPAPVITYSQNPGTSFNKGTTTVTVTATNACGSVSCNFDVIVSDGENPTISCPGNITQGNDAGTCGAVVTYSVGFADNCSGATLLQTAGLPSGATFPKGTTTNSFVATDGSGNTATCSFDVIINDTENPTISCPGNITRGNDAGTCGAVVIYSVGFADNCPGATIAQTAGLPSGATFPKGKTINSFTVTDAAGNTASCSFQVIVSDEETPTISCPGDITTNVNAAGCSAIVNYNVGYNDNCSATLSQLSGLASGAAFPLGSTTNTFAVTDGAGHSTTCSFKVTVTTNLAVNGGIDEQTFYGYTGDQTVNHTAIATGGSGGYSYSWSLSRPLLCNLVNSAGDETFSGGACVNNACPASGSSVVAPSCSGSAAVSATLAADGDLCVHVSDSKGCVANDCFHIYAEDARCFAGGSTVAKVTICHKTGSTTNPWVQICIAQAAVQAHLAANLDDYVGKCVSSSHKEDDGDAQLGITNTDAFGALKAYPNPFNDKLNIEFTLSEDSKVKLEVFNVEGQLLGVLFEGDVKAAELHKAEFNALGMAKGMVVYRLQTAQKTFYGRAMLMK
jgi:hypothetical protein